MSRKAKASLPPEREKVLEQVRTLLLEHFDCGLVVTSWEDGGETFHMHSHWGNHYAVESLSEKAHSFLFPYEEEEDDDEEETA